RLELFLSICEAIQHAHQKGIIHRDIKPSNILVAIAADHAIPTIIDFGVAKALGQSLTDRTLVTEQTQMIGTPEYMSPEQAEMTSQDIDTRSDIYSLGVLLYELLTGVLPFEAQSLRAGGPDHIRRTIREEDPKTPSTRLSKIAAEESAKLAQLRRTDVRTLSRRLHGDLDWITLKAMEKDRTRRYASVGEFAADIRRHLSSEPVLAGPPGALYRLRKYIRRHQALATGLAAVFLALLAGIAGIVAFAVKADRQARTAQAVTDFLGEDLLGSVALQQAMSQTVTVESIVAAAAERLEGQFVDRPLVEASIRQYLGKTYIELGDYRQAEPHLERACAARRRQLGDRDLLALDSMSQLGRLHLLQGRYTEAEPLLARALESRRRLLGPDHIDTLETSIWLGLVYKHLHQPEALQKAEELLTSAFESCNRLFGKEAPITLEAMYGLAFLHFGGPGQEGKALPLCFEGWEIARKVLGEGHRLTFDFMVMGAWLEAWTGQFEQAERHAQIGIETGKRVLGEAHPQTIMAHGTLGTVYHMQHLFEKAEEQLAEAVRLGSRTLGTGNSWVLQYMCKLGHVNMMQGKYAEAERLLTEVRADGRSVYTESYPVVLEATSYLIVLYAMQERGDTTERWCLDELDRLAQADDGNRSARAHILNALAWLQATYPSAAVRDGAKAIENAKKACELSDRSNPNFIDTLAAAYAEAGDFAAAVREERVAVQLAASRDDTP
ncbi:MAG: tetratricopeptide repeat protein, partial [Planctomycetota bacterium]